MRDKLLNAATVLMVCLAVASTVYTFRRQSAVAATDNVEIPTRRQADWRNYVAGGHAVGPAGAPVTIVEFADFQCPFCEELRWSVDTLRARHPNDVRFIFRHLPLPIHRSAVAAAVASECAGEQGRFEPMFDALFSRQDSIGLAPFWSFARSAGVPDSSAFETCMRNPASIHALAQDTTDAIRLGARATPTLLINDLRVEGVAPLDSLEAYVTRAKAARAR